MINDFFIASPMLQSLRKRGLLDVCFCMFALFVFLSMWMVESDRSAFPQDYPKQSVVALILTFKDKEPNQNEVLLLAEPGMSM